MWGIYFLPNARWEMCSFWSSAHGWLSLLPSLILVAQQTPFLTVGSEGKLLSAVSFTSHSQPWSPTTPSHPILTPSSPKSQSVRALRAQDSASLFSVGAEARKWNGKQSRREGGWVAGKGRKEKLQPSATEDLDRVLPPEEGCFSKHSLLSKGPLPFLQADSAGILYG